VKYFSDVSYGSENEFLFANTNEDNPPTHPYSFLWLFARTTKNNEISDTNSCRDSKELIYKN